jgi:serine/threonine protein kinase
MLIEVIQETSYDARADIWSLGITMIELCEGQPPHFNVHPMRAIFMIPMKPSPVFKNPAKWSSAMNNFLSRCLQKKSDDRATAEELLNHPWIEPIVVRIKATGTSPVLKELFDNNIDAITRMRAGEDEPFDSEKQALAEAEENDKTLKRESVRVSVSDAAMVKKQAARNASLKAPLNNSDTMRTSESSVFTRNNTLRISTLTSNLENEKKNYSKIDISDEEDDDDSTPRASNDDRKKQYEEEDEKNDGNNDYSGTMRMSNVSDVQNNDQDSVKSEMNAALKYFQRTPTVQAITGQSEIDKLLVAIEGVALDAKLATPEDIALQVCFISHCFMSCFHIQLVLYTKT